ncbi:hypothetical protein CL619_03990 [archaeon]|nr:hypothetical protein [archaeon]|tara:strand:+ start:962 stop:1252 length:291 start_codon:yes stop_codon:yes gene_type:complete
MSDEIYPKQEWNSRKLEALQDYERDLEKRLVGKTVEIKFCDSDDQNRWRRIVISVSGVRYKNNDNGYVDVNGPTFYDSDGKSYQTHPGFGVKIIGE